MRDERRPIWEDSYNQGGGTWRFRCEKKDTVSFLSQKQVTIRNETINNLTFSFQSIVWKELLLAAIGEQFSDSLHEDDEICGLTVSVREKFDVVQLWNVNAELASKANVINKVIRLLPEVEFAEPLYKRMY